MEKKVSILVAEDNEQLGKILVQVLNDQQYDATLALDGQLALFQLIDKKFDIIILDLKMPKVSGYAILKYVKTTIPATKVIVLTAYASLSNIEECTKLGADYVIPKPYDQEVLFQAIELLLKK
jgi:CheY-like chemotaxis protein